MAERPALAQRGLKNPPDRAGVSASRPARPKSPEFTFEREDWTLFRSLSTLSQKAGVPVHLLPKLVLKELADNALDAGGTVRVGQLEDGGWYVEDDGPGIAGEPADIARLFSIRRPLVSSKLLRLPTRGALGNGLRVVAGAVLASDGRLVLETRGRRLELRPQDNGDTLAAFEPCARTTGTRIEIRLGEGLSGSDALAWARSAAELAGRARSIGAARRRTGTTARRSSICSRRPGAAACASWSRSSTAAPAPRPAGSPRPSRDAPAAA